MKKKKHKGESKQIPSNNEKEKKKEKSLSYLHPSIRKSLLPLHPFLLKSLTCRIEIINRYANMSKPLWLTISIVVHFTRLLLGAVVPRQFENPLSIGDGVDAVDGFVAGGFVAIGEEVERKVGSCVFAEEGHAHDFLVEFE